MKKSGRTAWHSGITMICWVFSFNSQANDQYNQGADYARQVQNQGTAAMQAFKPNAVLPYYTPEAPEKSHYGGVTSPGADLALQGNAALTGSDVGKAITASLLNNPKEKLSMEAPFISAGKAAQNTAEQVTDGRFDGCQMQSVSHTEFTQHVCSRDTRVEQACSRKATITGEWTNRVKVVTRSYNLENLPFYPKNRKVHAVITPDVTGDIIEARYRYENWASNFVLTIKLLGTSFIYRTWGSANEPFWPTVTKLQAGKPFEIVHSQYRYNDMFLFTIPLPVTITLTIKADHPVFTPRIAWSEHCPFSKLEGALSKTECIEKGGDRTLHREGKAYTLSSDCWAYRDSYITQTATQGTCAAYVNNSACTLATRQCDYRLDGFCLHENLTYSCEHKTSRTGMLCGGQFFCQDGRCAQSAAAKNTLFQQAVAELAAVAAAGKDASTSNSTDIKAFTGRPQSCKKFAVGFNNCCQDTGWGNDLGLAHCSSEEKALGQAKARRLIVDVGEYCSKKVLGVCLEKKRSYCLFDSKLAQIVQQQGRQWQLGIGFGEAKSPDCRGISANELQRIRFDNLDFSHFYADLQKGSNIPEDNQLMQRVQQQMQHQINRRSTGGK